MSIIFGVRKSEGEIIGRERLLHLASATDRYALDGTFVNTHKSVGMGVQPYYTHERSRLDTGPITGPCGNMLVFDGRLDNHEEVCSRLDLANSETSDSAIVLAAFARWSDSCFALLTGDWSLALWCHRDNTLYLARDHAGTRALYYEIQGETILWTSHLETFFADRVRRPLDDRYVAAYLSCQPTRELTPYRGVHSVPPAHYLKFGKGRLTSQPHWTWMTQDQVSYRNDSEYDEQFLSLFRQSLLRRTGTGAPILAQLSGGMDSTAIVCVSDEITRGSSASSADLLDTISFFNDSEPAWNERPYFELVEKRRGKTGFHLPISFDQHTYKPLESGLGVYRTPGQDSSSLLAERKLQQIMAIGGYRVFLSGAGGDEVLGGVPNALPELADLLRCGRLYSLCERAFSWCLPTRKPLMHLLGETMAFTVSTYCGNDDASENTPVWLAPSLARAPSDSCRLVSNTRRLRLMPSAICNGNTWWDLLDSLPHLRFTLLPSCEYRYPYLDKDLIDFLFRVPRSQIVQPGRRRFLMRRALKGIVPDEVLERRRKAYTVRGPISSLQQSEEAIRNLFRKSEMAERGWVDPSRLECALHSLLKGANPVNLRTLTRAIALEIWLKSSDEDFGPAAKAA